MIPLLFSMFVLSSTLLMPPLANACPAASDRHNLNLWVCDLQSAMEERDKEARYLRHIELISATSEIKKIRTTFVISETETCRNFKQSKLIRSFQRILEHQSLPPIKFNQQSELVVADILSESTRNSTDVCESQHLISRGHQHTYLNLYYFKFGPVRDSKHFLLQITTTWDH